MCGGGAGSGSITADCRVTGSDREVLSTLPREQEGNRLSGPNDAEKASVEMDQFEKLSQEKGNLHKAVAKHLPACFARPGGAPRDHSWKAQEEEELLGPDVFKEVASR